MQASWSANTIVRKPETGTNKIKLRFCVMLSVILFVLVSGFRSMIFPDGQNPWQTKDKEAFLDGQSPRRAKTNRPFLDGQSQISQ